MPTRFEYIDFIKGIAIVSVILLHSLSTNALHQSYALFHIWQAVPVFVAVTFYLSCNSIDRIITNGGGYNLYNQYFSREKLVRLLKKILLPWAVVLLIQFLLIFALQIIYGGDYLIMFLKNGGTGPGSYYCHIYLQFWVLMPFIYKLLSIKKNPLFGIVLLFVLCVIANIILNIINPSPESYRLLFIRYLFLACISYIWLRYDVKLTVLAILSAISIIYWYVTDSSFGIFTYSEQWSTQNWPAYFYTLFYIKLLQKLYNVAKNTKIANFVCSLGRDSWYIFLLQMCVFIVFRVKIFTKICHYAGIYNEITITVIYVMFALCASIIPVYLFRFYQTRRQVK